MRCSRCGIRCRETEILLSEADIKRLENYGYNREEFMRYDKKGFAKPRNYREYRVFYDTQKGYCDVYSIDSKDFTKPIYDEKIHGADGNKLEASEDTRNKGQGLQARWKTKAL